MTKETLDKANELSNKLEEYKLYLRKISYTQSESVVVRESYFKCNGMEDSIKIPKSLFRVIGKLVQSEYIQEIDRLENELNNL